MTRVVFRLYFCVACTLALIGIIFGLSADYLGNASFQSNTLITIRQCIFQICQSPETQWMVASCLAVYLCCLFFVRFRSKTDLSCVYNDGVSPKLLALFAAIVFVRYFADYSEAVRTTTAIVLACGMFAGQVAAAFITGVGTTMKWCRLRFVFSIYISFLAASVLFHNDAFVLYQYHQHARWVGLWENPNTFGALMAVGLELSVGLFLSGIFMSRRASSQIIGSLILAAAAALFVSALVKSYSRGAWIAAIVGVLYIGYPLRQRLCRFFQRRDDYILAGVVLLSVISLSFWHFRDVDEPLIQRAFSIINPQDFSSQNRLASYQSVLQMLSEETWGFGWNRAERVCEYFYKPGRLAEGVAFKLNDYFALATTLGLPALLCFQGYIWTAIRRWSDTNGSFPIEKARGMTVSPPFRCDKMLMVACQAVTITLLVSFWFDGGLFNSALTIPFWIFFELGAAILVVS